MHILLGLLCLGLGSPLGHGVDWSRLLGGLGSLHGLGSQVLSSGQFSILLGDSGIRIELEHGADVLQRVGLDHSTLHLLVGSSQHLPDGLALEQGRQVSVGHLGLGQVPACLGRAWLAPGAVQTIQLLEGCFGPDAESANMTSRSQLQEVEVVNLDGVNSRDVPECLGQTLILIIDDKRSSLLDVTSVSQLTLTGSHTSGGVHLGNIIPGLVTSEEHDSLLSLLKSLDLVGHNKRNLADAIDDVTLSHDQSGDPSGGNGGAHGVPLLGDIDLPVPPSPGLGGGEHTTSTAHVTESSLAGPVGTSSRSWWGRTYILHGTCCRKLPGRTCGYLLWATLIFLCHLLQVLVGANIHPPRHMLPKAPWPDLWVPPPLTLGILATALPVPQDSALVWCPASTLTQ